MFNFKKNDMMIAKGNDSMNLGKTINELRKKNNMTQEELAAKLGVSPQAVSKWENDLSCPDISLLPDVAKIFHITVDELLSGNYQENEIAQPENPEPSFDNTKVNKGKKINISVDNHGKVTNVSLPIKLVQFGMKIGSAYGGLTNEHTEIIMNAIRNDLRGEIVKVDGENGEVVTVSIE